MNIRLVLATVAALTAASIASANYTYFTSAPTPVNHDTDYYLEATADSGNYGSNLTIWKDGVGAIASDTGYWGGYNVGGWTRDNGPATVYFTSEVYDYYYNQSWFDYAAVQVNGGATNSPPAAWVEVDGQSNGATVVRPYGGSVNVTVRYKATDANGNLSGIRPQAWEPSGHLSNNSGAFVGASGGSGEVVWTVTLNQNGDWYFWTDATDTTMYPNYVDSGAWTSGFRINVVEGAPPNSPPVASVVVDGHTHGATVTRPFQGSVNVTVRYRATDANGNLSGIRPQVWDPAGNLNNNGGAFIGQSGGSGEVAWNVTLNQDGNWYFWSDATDTAMYPNYTDSGAWTNGFRLYVQQGGDTTPPNTPTVTASLVASESFTATWAQPWDNAGVTGYNVQLSGQSVFFTTALSHAFSGLTPSTPYTVYVQARDAAGNWSGWGAASFTTSDQGGGGGPSGQGFYSDIDGDGIFDHVVKPNTPDFNYRIISWYSENPNYRTILVNNFWNYYGFTWFGAVSSDSLIWRPNFSYIWYHNPAFWVGHSTYFRVSYTFPVLSGERIGLYQDPVGTDQVNPANWYPLMTPTTFPSTSTQTVIPPQFDADLFSLSKFFLVKFGLPVGSVQILDPAGQSIAGTIPVNGTATIPLPPEGQVVLNVLNTANRTLAPVHRVAWKILNTAGEVLREGLGVNVDFDGLNLPAVARLVLLLDNAPAREVNVQVSPAIFMLSGHDKDVVTLSTTPVQGATYDWRLKETTGAQGSFQNAGSAAWTATGSTSQVVFRAGGSGPADITGHTRSQSPGQNLIELRVNGTLVRQFRIVVKGIYPRSSWGAVSPKPQIEGMASLSRVTVHHAAGTADGTARIKQIQEDHMGPDNFFDIGYHYVITKNGDLYEGRTLEGLGLQSGPFTKGEHVALNNTNAGIGVCLLGNYEAVETLPIERRFALQAVLTGLCRRHSLAATGPSGISYHQAMAVPGHPTACPGSNIIPLMPEIIQKVGNNLTTP